VPFGGWAIDESLALHIDTLIDPGCTILELGSGEGTIELIQHWEVYSIEHDEEWLYKFETNYIHAPLKEHKPLKHHEGNIWYDARVLEVMLPKIDYDLILVDGPPGHRGGGFVKYFDLFKHDVPIVFDDANLKRNWQVLRSISGRLKRPYTVYNCWNDEKDFGVIMP